MDGAEVLRNRAYTIDCTCAGKFLVHPARPFRFGSPALTLPGMGGWDSTGALYVQHPGRQWPLSNVAQAVEKMREDPPSGASITNVHTNAGR